MTSTILHGGDTVRLQFPGRAGQRVFVQIPHSSVSDQCDPLELDDPSGKELSSGCIISGKGLIDATTLPTDGDYSIVFHPEDLGVGSATLQVIADHDQMGTIALDGPSVVSHVAEPGATSTFSFQGRAGSKVFTALSNSTFPDACGAVSITDPNGHLLGSGCAIQGPGDIDTTTLPTSGTYRLTVDPSGVAVGQIDVRLSSVHDQTSSITIGGPPVSATVTGPGAVARLMMSGLTGQSVTIAATSSTLPDGCQVRIGAPDGTQIGTMCVITGIGMSTKTILPADGVYTITIDPSGAAVGTTVLQVEPAP